jgi:hypothetical protein
MGGAKTAVADNNEKLPEHALHAMPEAGLPDPRRLVPSLASVRDNELEAGAARIRRKSMQ